MGFANSRKFSGLCSKVGRQAQNINLEKFEIAKTAGFQSTSPVHSEESADSEMTT